MKRHTIAWAKGFLPAVFIALLVSGCSFTSTDIETLSAPSSGLYFIEDANGDRWDVTHAVTHYGFQLSFFSSGKGPYARAPIIDPEMLSPGDPGYPPAFATTQVLAVAVGSAARAYSRADIMRNEVVDETFAGAHIAVAY